MAEMGRVASTLLLERIANPKAPAAHRVLPVCWTEGQSIAAPAAIPGH